MARREEGQTGGVIVITLRIWNDEQSAQLFALQHLEMRPTPYGGEVRLSLSIASLAKEVIPVIFRTQQLSSLRLKVLGAQAPGSIGSCQTA
jgi:hypothetical protein